MTNRITIDDLGLKPHARYAQDQTALDPRFVQESAFIPQHAEITGTSTIFPSCWEQIFEMQKRNVPYAAFSPPLRFRLQSKRFFKNRIIVSIDPDDFEKDEWPESEEKEVILKLLGTLKDLDAILEDANSCILQYRKG